MDRGGSKKKRGGNRNPAADIPDDLLVDILSRLPVKSVCRFKCASRHWRDGLIANPAYRTKLPQTLTGFFRRIEISSTTDGDGNGDDNEDGDSDDETSVPDFVSIVGRMDAHQVVISPSLSFLPRALYRSIVPKHCSNGLLLCLCWKVSPTNEADYVVCNPATEKWVVLPGNNHRNMSEMQLHLAVDPASSSGHFHLFAILEEHDVEGFIYGVDIYSSETGAWSHKENGWKRNHSLHPVPHSVFLRGILYLITQIAMIIYVDTEGTTWGTISVQVDMDDMDRDMIEELCMFEVSFIGESQGRLHYVTNLTSRYRSSKLSVWILDDNDEWILKYKISEARLFEAKLTDVPDDYCLVAIHPECNTIFFTAGSHDDKTLLLSYHMDRRELRVLGTFDRWSYKDNPYLPYIPSFRVIAS